MNIGTVTMAFRAAAELRKVGALPHDERTTVTFLVGSPSSKPRRSAVMTHERAKLRERTKKSACEQIVTAKIRLQSSTAQAQ